jgi:hypothetical protein
MSENVERGVWGEQQQQTYFGIGKLTAVAIINCECPCRDRQLYRECAHCGGVNKRTFCSHSVVRDKTRQSSSVLRSIFFIPAEQNPTLNMYRYRMYIVMYVGVSCLYEYRRSVQLHTIDSYYVRIRDDHRISLSFVGRHNMVHHHGRNGDPELHRRDHCEAIISSILQ